jgi:hypothetical protein
MDCRGLDPEQALAQFISGLVAGMRVVKYDLPYIVSSISDERRHGPRSFSPHVTAIGKKYGTEGQIQSCAIYNFGSK